MKHYYYSENEQQFGPFTFDELKTKRIKKSTLVWTDGLPEWTAAENVNELIEMLIAEPPPLPKKIIPELKTTNSSTTSSYQDTKTKYDLSYKKETGARDFGICILVLSFVALIWVKIDPE